ncbi:c2H2-type domain-containing protein [Trichonephila clavipes]|uniref:C2H2-type domain-containing protein n=1 Tax=Trichonephila clavipes TaxID=2585209 RepID=A0A8X6SKW2_TRICX|nr:c2H2-type domain-containing protein [Trichonephila clavipes]
MCVSWAKQKRTATGGVCILLDTTFLVRFIAINTSAELIPKKALEDHIDLVHNITIEKKTRSFDTFKDFKLWKESIEKQTSFLYVKNTGSKSEKTGGKITYFYCHHNGFYNARVDKKRNMKIAGRATRLMETAVQR